MSLSSLFHEALSPRYLVLYPFVPSALYVHFRSKVRQPFYRQLFGHSTLMAPFNVLMYLFSGVPRTAFLDVREVPELELLREHWEELRDEARTLHERGFIRGSEAYDDAGFNSFFRRGWRRFYLKWYGDPPASARELCPRTLALLERVPAVRAAMFVNMAQKSRLPKHRDPFAGSLRYHLGLETPNSEACRINVDGTNYWWKDGEGVLFDETYVHWARNDTEEERLILFCDVERPMKSRALAFANRWVGRHVMRAARTRNVPGEEVGVINRIFGLIYPIRVAAKRLKKFDARVYYVTKYVLVLAGAYLIFI